MSPLHPVKAASSPGCPGPASPELRQTAASTLELQPLHQGSTDLYQLPGFVPRLVDQAWLDHLGVQADVAPESLAALAEGCRRFQERLASRRLLPEPRLILQDIDPDSPLEIHNYTGACPTLTWEINPVKGCQVGCQYCLVSDGVHETNLVAHPNYPELVARHLEAHHQSPHYYYFSPKTEALQEPTLQTGIAHGILQAFIRHYRQRPASRARLFIASKAGTRELEWVHDGQSILDLFEQLKGRMQFNTSLSIMPGVLRQLLEPYAASLEDRLAAVRLCQGRGIMANSALVQPIITACLSPESMESFFRQLAGTGIINYKPEFLTLCMENLAMIAQVAGWFDPDLERRLYEDYLPRNNADHRKQRGRTAPDRQRCRDLLGDMFSISEACGLSTSICYWVRRQLGISESLIPVINRNGFQCLGYQSHLLD